MPSGAEAIVTQVRHVIGAEASDAAAAKASDVIATNAGHVVSTEAADATTAKATHVAAAKASHAATMPSASTAAAARFCTGGNKAAGKYRACQNHHHSSSHDILHLRWADIPPQVQTGVGAFLRRRANVAIGWRWECCFAIPIKFAFIKADLIRPPAWTGSRARI
jgi:hypothetical protein